MWGAVALDGADPDDVDRALERGCVGVSLPAGALAGVEALRRVRRCSRASRPHGAPLLVHPGPGLAEARRAARRGASLARMIRCGGRR